MEHDLWFEESTQRFIKITQPGGFGRMAKIENGRIWMRPAPPLVYLRRLSLGNEWFADDWRVVGVLIDRGFIRMVTSQPLVVGERPEQAEVIEYLGKLGFDRVGEEHAFCHRHRRLAVFDTHRGNFLRGGEGQIFAIDVITMELSLFEWEDLRRWSP